MATVKNNIPIIYHCDGTAVTEGGSVAFNEGDSVKICVPNNDWDQAYIQGFSSGLKECVCFFQEIFLGEEVEQTWSNASVLPGYNSYWTGTIVDYPYRTVNIIKNEEYWDISYLAGGAVSRFTADYDEGDERCIDQSWQELSAGSYTFYRLSGDYARFQFYTDLIYHNAWSSFSNLCLFLDLDLVTFNESCTLTHPRTDYYDGIYFVEVSIYFYSSTSYYASVNHTISTRISTSVNEESQGRKTYALDITDKFNSYRIGNPYMKIEFKSYFPYLWDTSWDPLSTCEEGWTLMFTDHPIARTCEFNTKLYSVKMCTRNPGDGDTILTIEE